MGTRPASFLFRRRNSITASAVPSRLLLPSTTNTKSSSFPPPSTRSVDFELISFKSDSYTSIKDILPQSISAVNSPTANSPASISIRHRLVKQAAYAYLQPMSTSPSSPSRHWFRFTGDYFKNPIIACFRFFNRIIIPAAKRAFENLFRVIRIRRTQR